jgi:hypothetical protein
MRKFIFIAAILSSITFFACGGGTTSPQAFNGTAIDIFKEANKTLDEFDSKITAGVKSSDLSSIAEAAESALEKVDGNIEKLKAINAPQSAEKYKESVLKSLDEVKAVIESGKKYAALTEGYSKSEFNALEKEYNKKRKQLSNELKNVATAQAEFMKAISAK